MIIQIFVLLDYLGRDKIIPLVLTKLSGETLAPPPQSRRWCGMCGVYTIVVGTSALSTTRLIRKTRVITFLVMSFGIFFFLLCTSAIILPTLPFNVFY
jgi:hypothetical protein